MGIDVTRIQIKCVGSGTKWMQKHQQNGARAEEHQPIEGAYRLECICVLSAG